jgi:hypothetical protein
MNLRNFLSLTIRVTDFNLVARQPDLLEKLRKLTLSPYSGLNFEMDRMLEDIKQRSVNCQVLLAYRFNTLVGWAILSKEDSKFHFHDSASGFNSEDGLMFQIFVNPSNRRQGIASELFKGAMKLAQDETICICPWDNTSYHFYSQFPNVKTKRL